MGVAEMKPLRILFILSWLLMPFILHAQDTQHYEIKSPDGDIKLAIHAESRIQWSMYHKGQPIIAPSAISLSLQDRILGENAMVESAETKKVNTWFTAVNYSKARVPDVYNQLTLTCKDDFGIIFRVYDEAVAYRFFTTKDKDIIIQNEKATFTFTADHEAFIPYMQDYRAGKKFNASFESLYTEQNISQFAADSLAILPLLVNVGNGKKVVILEADLEHYPGMYLILDQNTSHAFKSVYAEYPLEVERGGFNNMNLIPEKRADYIAKTNGERMFPWRVVVISEQDKELLDIDIVQQLASPSRIDDVSWIKPGQVAWDWWDGYNVFRVDFKSGMNTLTFKYYIDFAAANGAAYIILDAGWSDTFDLNSVNPDVDLAQILDYAEQNNVGVILWAAWCTILEQMHEVFPKYADMGVKGWKIDFIDRDDQIAVASTYEIARLAAEYKFLIDYHGIFKPTGLQRTYPNVVGYEGVYGLENFKWADINAPRYALTIPYIRNLAGPMDYTPGSLRNATEAAFKARHYAPMSKGTRCHQMAQYVVFKVPLQMLSDTPTLYMREQECTDFITRIPTVFDKTVPLDGKVAEYTAMARQMDGIWYVGAMTNWQERDLTLDLSFLDEGNYTATIFMDGVNANREATDYQKVTMNVTAQDSLDIHLAQGGGWVARLVAE